jgi:hypothetical protein
MRNLRWVLRNDEDLIISSLVCEECKIDLKLTDGAFCGYYRSSI